MCILFNGGGFSFRVSCVLSSSEHTDVAFLSAALPLYLHLRRAALPQQHLCQSLFFLLPESSMQYLACVVHNSSESLRCRAIAYNQRACRSGAPKMEGFALQSRILLVEAYCSCAYPWCEVHHALTSKLSYPLPRDACTPQESRSALDSAPVLLLEEDYCA